MPHVFTGSRRRLAGACVLGLIVMMTVVAIGYGNTLASVAAERSVSRTHEVIAALEQLYGSIVDAETEQRAFVLTGLPEYEERARADLPVIDERLDVLNRLVGDNRRMTELRDAVKARERYIDATLSLRVTGGFPAAQSLAFSDGAQNTMKRVDGIIASMRAEEQQLLSERSRVSRQRASHDFLISSMGGVLDAVLLGIVFVILDRKV